MKIGSYVWVESGGTRLHGVVVSSNWEIIYVDTERGRGVYSESELTPCQPCNEKREW